MNKIIGIIYRLIYSRGINFLLRNFNKLVYPWLTRFRLHPSGQLSIRTSAGKKLKLETNQTDFVAFCVFWDGLYEYEYLGIFEKIMQRCQVFVDVGANTGLFSLLSASTNQHIKTIAIDPSLAASHYVPLNIELNQMSKNISFENVALSDRDETMTFFEVKNPKYTYLDYNLGGASSLYVKPENYLEKTVSAKTLDDLLKTNYGNLSGVDFVKIDAEGAEPKIIRGMHETIIKDKPIIVCEILFGLAENDLEEVFAPYDYKYYFHKGDKLYPQESISREHDDGVRNCFFVHPEKEALIKDFVSHD